MACGEGDALESSQSSFSEPWVSGDISSDSASREAPGNTADPYDAEQDGGEFIDGDPFEAFFYGEATVRPDTSYEGLGEFWAIRTDDEGEVIRRSFLVGHFGSIGAGM